MARIQAIEAFPDNKSHSVKPINLRDDDKIRKSCTACKFRGHSVTECWGKCQHCRKYGRKSSLCRHKPDQPESEPAKKVSVDGKTRPNQTNGGILHLAINIVKNEAIIDQGTYLIMLRTQNSTFIKLTQQ